MSDIDIDTIAYFGQSGYTETYASNTASISAKGYRDYRTVISITNFDYKFTGSDGNKYIMNVVSDYSMSGYTTIPANLIILDTLVYFSDDSSATMYKSANEGISNIWGIYLNKDSYTTSSYVYFKYTIANPTSSSKTPTTLYWRYLMWAVS